MKDYTFKCRLCGKEVSLNLDENKVKRWVEGEHIQNLFPELDPGTRELMISGICGECFDKLFGNEEDE